MRVGFFVLVLERCEETLLSEKMHIVILYMGVFRVYAHTCVFMHIYGEFLEKERRNC